MGAGGASAHDPPMTTTLHIEVQINDLSAWKAGFADHADARQRAGVRNALVRHPVGDQSRLVIDLDFDSAGEANAFLNFLQNDVWKDQPTLAGPPSAAILEPLALV
jgi:hypothetical protein